MTEQQPGQELLRYLRQGRSCSRSCSGTSGRVQELLRYLGQVQEAVQNLRLLLKLSSLGIFPPSLLLQDRLAPLKELGSPSLALPAPLFAFPLSQKGFAGEESQKDFCPQLESLAEEGSAFWAVLRSALRHLEGPHGWHRAAATKLKTFPEPDPSVCPGAAPAQPEQHCWLLGSTGSPPSAHSPHLWAGRAHPLLPSLIPSAAAKASMEAVRVAFIDFQLQNHTKQTLPTAKLEPLVHQASPRAPITTTVHL